MSKRFLLTPENRCPDCGELRDEECPECGGTYKLYKFQNTCIKCGRELEDDWVRCPICETKILPCSRCNGTGRIDIWPPHSCPDTEEKKQKGFDNLEGIDFLAKTPKKQDDFPFEWKTGDSLNRASEKEEDRFILPEEQDITDTIFDKKSSWLDEFDTLKIEDKELDSNSSTPNQSQHFSVPWRLISFILLVAILIFVVIFIIIGAYILLDFIRNLRYLTVCGVKSRGK